MPMPHSGRGRQPSWNVQESPRFITPSMDQQIVYCTCYSTFQVGCLREIRNNGEIGIRSVDAKITQTTNPIVNMTKTIGL